MVRGKTVVCFLFLLYCLTASAGASEDMARRAKTIFKPIPTAPPALENNRATPSKIELGKMLYFDPRLSSSALISCNTCHNIGMGGDDYQETSIGHGWQKGPRNAPTVLNSVYNIAQFWDGRAPSLKEQAKGPVQAGVEMNNTPDKVLKTLGSMPGYVKLFGKVFADSEEPLSFENMAKAIEAFEATLLTPDSSFDQYLKGSDQALTPQEKEGLKLFMDKGCSACHGGINMGGSGYFPFGVVKKPSEQILAGDTGRYKITGTQADEYVFKSPSLRNIALTPPYFHSGKVWGLKEAVTIMGSAQLGITLSAGETENIVGFLISTTGEQPKVSYPILPASTEATPKPKLD